LHQAEASLCLLFGKFSDEDFINPFSIHVDNLELQLIRFKLVTG